MSSLDTFHHFHRAMLPSRVQEWGKFGEYVITELILAHACAMGEPGISQEPEDIPKLLALISKKQNLMLFTTETRLGSFPVTTAAPPKATGGPPLGSH